jgi:CheY-like chemotaxis protein
MTDSESEPLRILLVEDEPALQRALVRLLSGRRADITVAPSVERARELLASDLVFDMVLSDVNLGEESGFALAEHAVATRPALRGCVVLMTASIDTGPLDARADALGCPLLRKPFAAAEFFRLVAA